MPGWATPGTGVHWTILLNIQGQFSAKMLQWNPLGSPWGAGSEIQTDCIGEASVGGLCPTSFELAQPLARSEASSAAESWLTASASGQVPPYFHHHHLCWHTNIFTSSPCMPGDTQAKRTARLWVREKISSPTYKQSGPGRVFGGIWLCKISQVYVQSGKGRSLG